LSGPGRSNPASLTVPDARAAERAPHAAASRPATISCLVATLLLIAGALLMWRQPIMADEVDFMWAAKDWWANSAMVPHPPAYVHLIRLLFWLLRPSVGAARLLGVVSAVATVWLIPPLVRTCFAGTGREETHAALAVLIFGVSPLAAQNMMLIDIDNTVLSPLLMAAALLWLRSDSWPRSRRIGAMTLAIATLAWFKLPPVILLVFALLVTALAARRREDLAVLLLGAGLGAALFAVTFRIHEAATGFGYSSMSTTFQKVGTLRDIKAMLLRIPQSAGVLVMWLTLPQSILLLAGLVPALRQRAPGPRFLAVYTLTVFVFYFVATPPAWGYPKYDATIVPVIAVLAAWVLERSLARAPARVTRWALALVILVFAAQAALIGDPLWEVYRQTFETSIGQLAVRLRGSVLAFAPTTLLLLAALALSLGIAAAGGRARAASVSVMLGATMFGMLGATNWVQLRADYSTRYRYTSRYADLSHACDRLRSALAPGSFIAATKEVLYYTGFPGNFVQYYVWGTVPPDSILGLTRRRAVAAFCWTTKEENRSPQVLGDARVDAMLHASFAREQFGDYILWLQKRPGS